MYTAAKKWILLFGMGVLFSCTPKLEVPDPSPGSADLSRSIAVGGAYLCGYQDGALTRSGQQKSIANLVAQQFKLVGGSDFTQALMPDDKGLGLNSRPWESPYVSASHLGFKTDCEGVTSLSPLKELMSAGEAGPYLQASGSGNVQDLSVPFATLSGISTSGFQNVYYQRLGNYTGTGIVEAAKNQSHSFCILWLGMDDIYEYARFGGFNKNIPPPSAIEQVVKDLSAAGKYKGVIANIPGLDVFPFYRYIDPRAVDLDQHFADSLNQATGNIFGFTEGKNGFAIEYPKQSGYYRQMTSHECVLLNVPTDSLKCNKMGIFNGMPDRYSLDSMELETIETAIAQYNLEIERVAKKYDLALVDVHGFFQKLAAGIKYDGVEYNNAFISGGFLSLDGFYPNQKGYSMLANEFIKAINLQYGASVPGIHCSDCNGIKFP